MKIKKNVIKQSNSINKNELNELHNIFNLNKKTKNINIFNLPKKKTSSKKKHGIFSLLNKKMKI